MNEDPDNAPAIDTESAGTMATLLREIIADARKENLNRDQILAGLDNLATVLREASQAQCPCCTSVDDGVPYGL